MAVKGEVTLVSAWLKDVDAWYRASWLDQLFRAILISGMFALSGEVSDSDHSRALGRKLNTVVIVALVAWQLVVRKAVITRELFCLRALVVAPVFRTSFRAVLMRGK